MSPPPSQSTWDATRSMGGNQRTRGLSAGSIRTAAGRPACFANACIFTAQSATDASVRGLSIISPHTTAHCTWVQATGDTVRAARSARSSTGTRAGPNGETGEKCASLTPGSAHCTGKPRGSGWDSGRTKLPNPRAPPTPSDADRGGGWERVRRHHRAGGSLEAAVQSER